jgi:hypothetical protein
MPGRHESPPLRAWIPMGVLVVLVVLGIAALTVRAAETPFGIGNGQVPDVVDRGICPATRALTERGLRWGFQGEPDVYSEALNPPETSSTPDCKLEVLRQSVRPGTQLREGQVIRLATLCSDTRSCG